MTVCVICGLEDCEDDARCALFWNLEQFNDHESDEPDEDERYEEQFDVQHSDQWVIWA